VRATPPAHPLTALCPPLPILWAGLSLDRHRLRHNQAKGKAAAIYDYRITMRRVKEEDGRFLRLVPLRANMPLYNRVHACVHGYAAWRTKQVTRG